MINIKANVITMPVTFSVEEAAVFRKEINDRISSGEINFILDFKDCSFIDSTGLGVIVAVYKKCMEAGGSLKLRSLSGPVLKVFRLTRLDKVFDIY